MKRGFVVLLGILLLLVLAIVVGLQHFKKEYKAFFEEIDSRYDQLEVIGLDSIPEGSYRARYG